MLIQKPSAGPHLKLAARDSEFHLCSDEQKVSLSDGNLGLHVIISTGVIVITVIISSSSGGSSDWDEADLPGCYLMAFKVDPVR